MDRILYSFFILLFIAGMVGWFLNIYKLFRADFAEPYKTEIIRGVGIPVWPMGAVSGYLQIGEEK